MQKLLKTFTLAVVLCACFVSYTQAAEVGGQGVSWQHCRGGYGGGYCYGDNANDARENGSCPAHGEGCDGYHGRGNGQRRGGCYR